MSEILSQGIKPARGVIDTSREATAIVLIDGCDVPLKFHSEYFTPGLRDDCFWQLQTIMEGNYFHNGWHITKLRNHDEDPGEKYCSGIVAKF